jgi:AcrR family transcriptional regulator
MTGSRAPLRRDTQETRDRLLDAVRDLLVESGPTFGLPELARRGGVATATAYRHFETVHDAYREFYLRLTDQLVERVASVPVFKPGRRRFDLVCERWIEEAASWGPAAVHIRSWQGFLDRVHGGDEPTTALYSALEPIIVELIGEQLIPPQDTDYALLVWITLFDERVIVDLGQTKGWTNRHIAKSLAQSVLSALGG